MDEKPSDECSRVVREVGMSQFANLNADSRAKVNAKLAALVEKTGQAWSCEVINAPDHEGLSSLEITVDGHTSRPVALQGLDDKPADRICHELDRLENKMIVG